MLTARIFAANAAIEILSARLWCVGNPCLYSAKFRFENCQWDEKTICVKEADVKIVPPYKTDDIHGDPKGIDHLKKIVSILKRTMICSTV